MCLSKVYKFISKKKNKTVNRKEEGNKKKTEVLKNIKT